MNDRSNKLKRLSLWIAGLVLSVCLWLFLLSCLKYCEPPADNLPQTNYSVLERPWMIPKAYFELPGIAASAWRKSTAQGAMSMAIVALYLGLPVLIVVSAWRIWLFSHGKQAGKPAHRAHSPWLLDSDDKP